MVNYAISIYPVTILYKNIFEIFVQITHLKQNGFNQKAVFQSLVLACIVCIMQDYFCYFLSYTKHYST